MITYKQIASIGGAKADAKLCADIAEFINVYGGAYFLDTPARIHHFLGQCHVESKGFSVIVESLNYSTAGVRGTFGQHRISNADCNRYGRSGGRAANQRAIANIVYGGAYGKKNLGNIEPNDGWDFRGSSIKQITGRGNFRAFTAWIRKLIPSAPDFEANPDLLRTNEWAVWPAVWYWVARDCYKFADKNDVLGLTERVNGGTNGLADRKTATAKAARIIGSALPSGVAATQPVAESVSTPENANISAKPDAPQREPVPVYGPEHESPLDTHSTPARQSVVNPAAAGGIGAAVVLAFVGFSCSLPQWFINALGYAAKCSQ